MELDPLVNTVTYAAPITMLIFLTNSILLEKLIVTQLVKKFPSFCETRTFITMFTTGRHWFLSLARCSAHSSTLFSKIHSHIIHLSTSRSSEWSLLFRFSNPNTVRISQHSYACYTSRPFHPRLDHLNNIW